ncbi:hypothetical protein Vi05172_g5546 [Venturia inaequalis]|nr:hypothetical protein Vi05172_g5546 [Venturia inaequalis]
MKPSTAILLLFAALTTHLPTTTAECCGDSITGCRGYGKCNAFCCNCDAEYREDWRVIHHPILCRLYVCIVDDGGPACTPTSNENEKKNILSLTDPSIADAEMFNAASAGTKQMSLDAFIEYSATKGMHNRTILTARFEEHDTNNDSVITIDEMRLA